MRFVCSIQMSKLIYENISIIIYIFICTCIYIHTYIYIYIYISPYTFRLITIIC